MKRNLFFGVLLLLATVSLSSCFKHVPPRNVGIKVKTLGDNKGVKPEVLTVGRYWIGMYWDLYTYPTNVTIYPFTSNADEGSEVDESMKFQDKDGLPLSCDVAISAHVNPDLVPTTFQTYGGDMETIIKTYVRQDLVSNFIDFSSEFSAEQIYSTKKMDMLVFAKAQLIQKYAESGVVINDVVYKSEIRLPDNVMAAINEKIKATQLATQKQNEIVQAEADAQKTIAKANGDAQSILLIAQAQAKANTLLSNSITPTLVQYELSKKWNGISPIYSGNGSVLPTIFPGAK